MGYEILPQSESLSLRGNRTDAVILEDVLREQLKKINRINHKGKEYLFSEENIQAAIQQLKSVPSDGLLRTNERTYDLLTLGVALEQVVDGDTRSFNLAFIDWKRPERNVFHACPEFGVERTRSEETARPDIVLFVNGIPFCVIECKSPQTELEQGISQMIRNQTEEYIPKLFQYVQMVVVVNRNLAQYATVGTPKKFWAVWKEMEDADDSVSLAANRVLTDDQKRRVFSEDFSDARPYFDELEGKGARQITEQDKILFGLCRPERVLDIAYRFTLFDGGIKKIARYQQFFVILSTLRRIKQRDAAGRRQGGVIWHTQGSGKSLTMVMLARCIAMDSGIVNPRIVLVTDREDLDIQLGNTFKACGFDPERANSGRNLLELIAEDRASLVTTLVHKFDKALNVRKYVETSPDIFILIDEAHRSQYRNMNARMTQMLPNACFLGFTGTPLLKKEKNSFEKFGAMIEPHYSITQAVEDGAVVPLLYEGRMIEIEQNRKAIDLWFERHTDGLTTEQKADLKKKYATANTLGKTEQVLFMEAFDISEHFRKTWQTTGLKGQVVAPSRAAAVQLKKYLDEIGHVSSEIIISPPDAREGYEDVDDEPTDEVVKYWQKMMKRYGSEEEYNKQIINQFKNGEEPELLIVKDKLLTGFDAPRNAVLYLCRTLRDHTLLQAIARVNRLCENKDFGFIVDYANVLGELDTALNMYRAFEGFDPGDMTDTLRDIDTQIDRLPQLHSDLWDIFKTVKNKQDGEEIERFLSNDEIRDEFYERLLAFAKCLAIAMSSASFLENTDEAKIGKYKSDLKRFMDLRKSVKLRYAEAISFRDYEPKIRKLLDTHIQANEAYRLNEPVNIFSDEEFGCVKEERGIYGDKKLESRADTIVHALKKTITERMDEDPAFYKKFSDMIQEAIDDFRNKRISATEYFDKATEMRDHVVKNKHDAVPSELEGNADAQAYFGVTVPYYGDPAIAALISLEFDRLMKERAIVHFWDNKNAQNDVLNAMDDFLFDVVKEERGCDLDPALMDELLEKLMKVALHRSSR
jgi:type I restriction enzyme R subunit